MPLAVAACTAVLLGFATAAAGDLFGYRASYYLGVLGAIGIGTLIALTRREPLRFVFLALIAVLPLASALVPPGRVGVTVFDAVMVALTISLLCKNVTSPDAVRQPLLPTRSLLVVWLLCIPCVVFSRFPLVSLPVFVLLFGLYVFFVLTLIELNRERGFERLVRLLSVVLIVMALGVFVDHIWHVNLSLRGSNLNQLTYLAGFEIYRAGGFFQDPQRCGAFFSALVTFLLVLALRGRFREPSIRLWVWLAVFAGLVALPMTISRSAILSCLLVSAGALFAFNGWSGHVKAAIAATLLVAAMLVVQTSPDSLIEALPMTLQQRFAHVDEELENRITIWFDTWDMFAEHPLTGIGLGSFRWYLLDTRPGVYNYYDIGSAAGVSYVPDQPESGYLKILYEGGFFGSVAVLLLVGDALKRGLTVAVSAADAAARTDCIAALAALATFAVTFFTLFTVSDQRVGALLAFLLAVIWWRSLERARQAHDAR